MKTKKVKNALKKHFKIRVFILMAIIVFYIFHIGKDSANYDKRHSVYVNETR